MGGCSLGLPEHQLGVLLALRWEQCEGQASDLRGSVGH